MARRTGPCAMEIDDFADEPGPWVPARERAVPAMDHRAGHRDTQFEPRFGRVICARLHEGETIRQIVADPRMPSYATLFHWLKIDPEFAWNYGRVRDDLARRRIAAALARRAAVAPARALARQAAGKPPRDWVSGRKSGYAHGRAVMFCDAIAMGGDLKTVTAQPDMPSVKQVYRWLGQHEAFRTMYVEARRMQRLILESQRADAALEWNRGEADRLDGRIGRLAPRVYRALP